MGIINRNASNFLGGVADVAKTAAMMQFQENLRTERDGAQAKRNRTLEADKRSFTSGENQLDRESREKIASSKASSAGGTTSTKDAAALMAQGYPKDIANAVAHGGMKQIKDDETGDMVLVNALNNKVVGRLTAAPGESGKVWLPEGEQTKNAPITSEHRTTAKETASEKAGYFSTDVSDFPETGGSRKKFIKQESQRLANKERGGGLIGGASGGKKPSDKAKPVFVGDAKFPEGMTLTKGGQTYIVKNGKPVLVNE
ncbi:MAG: hypothetical protein KAS93_00255 [Gammaproteobacteria bacterium]|nr:hypothetical protein [Gammaproteobacteria bacterium]